MRRQLTVIFVTIMLLSINTPGALGSGAEDSRFVKGMIVVKFNDDVALSCGEGATGIPSIDLMSVEQQVYSVEQVFPYLQESSLPEALELTKFYYFHYRSGADAAVVAKTFTADPNIAYAEPKYLGRVMDIPNDPFYASMTQFPHVEAPAAWDVIKGEAGDIIIAIVDNGTDWNHEDLRDNVWTNSGEIPDNGEDDDNNGFIDDVHGWNFPCCHNDPSPAPGATHGTHTAGTAVGVTNNGRGVASISWNCTLMPLNAYSPASWEPSMMEYGFEAIAYAAANGADIISNSWGTYDPSLFGQEVMNYAHANGAVIVAGAGNDGYNFDYTPMFPAGYDHVLSVGATNRSSDSKPAWSAYGVTVDVFAPGVGINSTVPDNQYELGSGCSMATPMVAGLAGLVKTLHPTWTMDQVREQVRVTCDNIDAMNPAYTGLLGHGRINALRAVTEDENPSIRIVNVSYTESGGDGTINAGDTVDVTVELINYLANANDISVDLTADVPLINITVGSAAIPNLNTDEIIPITFRFTVDPAAPDGHVLGFIVDIATGSYLDRDFFRLTADPLAVVTHTTNLIQTSVTTQGNLGWMDFAGSGGIGFLYNGENRLFEGGVLLANSAEQVSDCIRGTEAGVQENDFAALSELRPISPAGPFQQSSTVDLDDSMAVNPIGIVINQFAAAGVVGVPPANGALAICYSISNPTQLPVGDLYVGLFLDWNVNADQIDCARFDRDRRLGYVQDSATNPSKFAAVKLLTLDTGWSYRAIDNAAEIDNGFTKAEKWSFLSGGVQTQNLDGADVSTMIAAGPFHIVPSGRVVVAFCLIGANSLNELLATADVVQWVWEQWYPMSVDEEIQAAMTRIAMLPSYPNPTCGSTEIGFSLGRSGAVRLLVHDSQGRMLRRLVDGNLAAGSRAVTWDGRDNHGRSVSAGTYFYRLDASSQSVTRKVIVMK